MKKTLTTFLIALITITGFSQEFQGKATYKTHRKVDIKISSGNGPSSEMQKKFEEQFKKQFQKTYTLNFTQTESTYKQNEEISAPQAQANGVVIEMIGSGGQDILYKNIKEKQFVNQTEISGKRFLVKDSLEDYDWKLTSETKNIGNYTCYKATRTREVERTKFSTEDNKEVKEKVTIETVAWYTPQIPISNGPAKHSGLPGLILEIQDGKQTIVCSEIVLNPSEKIVIKKPSKGKKVTQEEFDAIMDKQREEMVKRFSNQRKTNNGDGITIEISK